MKLMIVESPNKVEKISGILGADWKVAASVGHIRDLPKEIGVHAPDFVPEYVYTDRGESVTKRLAQLAGKAQEVYLATDPDREGEAISWHVKEALQLKKYQRVTFAAITSDAIFAALDKPRQIDTHLVKAQEARRVLDRLIGYLVSRPLSDIAGRSGLSAGRVQSPAVRIVVERERAIKSFKETKHFGAEVSFDGGAWRAQWDTKPFLTGDDEYILDEGLATRAAACRDFVVTSASREKAYSAPPAPFTTSTMLQAASATLGFNPDLTGKLSQELFAAGLITYHRTDSRNFADEALAEIRAFASSSGMPLPQKARKWKSKESAQEAHEAIRPTHLEDRNAGANPQEQALYDLIWKRAVASQLADAEYSVTSLTLESGADADTFSFAAKGRTLVAPGWKTLTINDATNEDGDEQDAAQDSNRVPLLREDERKLADSGRVLNKATKPPGRFTEASLIKQMERFEIGRPSTYAAILKNVISREYLTLSKKYLVPTQVGCQVVDSLVGNFLFMEYKFTKTLEEELDNIAEGKSDYLQVVTLANDQLVKELTHVKATVPSAPRTGSANGTHSQGPGEGVATCPVCKQGRIWLRKNGDPSKAFWSCTGFKSDKTGCNFTIFAIIAKKLLPETAVKQLCDKRRTNSPIKGFTSKAGKAFEAHLKLSEDHRVVFEFADRKA